MTANFYSLELLSCLSGAICAAPVGHVGSRGAPGWDPCRRSVCYIHEHMLTPLMYLRVCVLLHLSVWWSQTHSELGSWRTDTSHRDGSPVRKKQLSSLHTHTHTNLSLARSYMHMFMKSWKAQDLRLAQRVFFQQDKTLTTEEDLQRRTSEQPETQL